MVIHKYTLQPGFTRFDDWPTGTEILSVNVQNNLVTMWVKKPSTPTSTTSRGVYVATTGETIELPATKFIGTVLLSGGTTVYHVFEVLTPTW